AAEQRIGGPHRSGERLGQLALALLQRASSRFFASSSVTAAMLPWLPPPPRSAPARSRPPTARARPTPPARRTAPAAQGQDARCVAGRLACWSASCTVRPAAP